MANKNLINRYKLMYKKIDEITPQIYASIALALHRKQGWGYKRINDLFLESQHIWEASVNNPKGMIQQCEDETGILVMNK